MAENRAVAINNRINRLKQSRLIYDYTLQQIADFVLINRGNFIRKTLLNRPETFKVFSNYAIEALHRLTSVVYNGITNPGSKWFNLHFDRKHKHSKEGQLDQVKFRRWLDRTTDHMLDIFNSSYSNFPTANYESLLSWGSLGTTCMYVEEDEDDGCVKFINVHISQIYFSTNTYGDPVAVGRIFKMKPDEIVAKWGIENVHPNVVQMLAKNPEDDIEILHFVRQRNEKIDGDSPVSKQKNFEFISTYMDYTNTHIMSEGGYHKQPYIISRFSVMSDSIWGRSPAWDCLSEVMMINVMHRDLLKTIQLQAMPPLMTMTDSLIPDVEIAPGMLLDGALNYDGTPTVVPLDIKANVQQAQYLIDKVVSRIRESFFVDQLYYQAAGQTPSTATEVQDKQNVRSAMLLPIINRLQHEYLNRVIDIVFDIEFRAGRIEKPDFDLGDLKMKAEYITPLSNQQKLEDVQAIQRFFSFAMPLAQADPTILDAIKFSDTGHYAALGFGLPGDLIRDKQELADLMAKRKAQVQAQQQQERMQQMQQAMARMAPGQQPPAGGQ